MIKENGKLNNLARGNAGGGAIGNAGLGGNEAGVARSWCAGVAGKAAGEIIGANGGPLGSNSGPWDGGTTGSGSGGGGGGGGENAASVFVV